MAAVGCNQDWTVPALSQGPDAGQTDAAPSSTGSQQVGSNGRKDSGQLAQEQRPGTSTSSGGTGGAGGSNASSTAGSGSSQPDGSAAHSGSSAPPGGGSGGTAGSAPSQPAQETCSSAGSLRCQGAAGQREICEAGVFRATDACKADEVCEDDGACVKVAAICQGSGGSNVCDGKGGLVSCAANGSVTSQESCASERHCQVGIATGHCPKCIPDEFRCDGVSLSQCDKDGQDFKLVMTCDSAALCKAESGACTDAACAANRFSCSRDSLMKCKADQTGFDKVQDCQPGLCDATRGECLACSAGSRSCDSDTALVCSSTGEMLSRSACKAPRSHCVGAGQCVECAVDAPCPAASDVCHTASCNLRTGSCENTQAMAGSACSLSGKSGVCDAAGGCGECLSEGDGRCAGATSHCTTAHTCVRCLEDSHCAFGEKCMNAACISKCGDGVLDPGEDCEKGYLNSNTGNCDFATCKRVNYINCRPAGVVCPAGSACLGAGYCMSTSDKNCVTSCPELPGIKVSCAQGICYLDCTNGGKCPSDMTCDMNASPDGTLVTDMCFAN